MNELSKLRRLLFIKRSEFVNGIAFLALAQLMVGINIITSKLLLLSIPILILLTMRFSLASLILFSLHGLSPAARQYSIKEYFSKLSGRDWGFIFAQALSAGILFNCLMLMGLRYTDAN